MTFDEFLLAMGEQPLVNVLHAKDFSLIDSLSLRLTDYLRQYYYVGGMPAAVLEFVESKNLEEVRNIQNRYFLTISVISPNMLLHRKCLV